MNNTHMQASVLVRGAPASVVVIYWGWTLGVEPDDSTIAEGLSSIVK